VGGEETLYEQRPTRLRLKPGLRQWKKAQGGGGGGETGDCRVSKEQKKRKKVCLGGTAILARGEAKGAPGRH